LGSLWTDAALIDPASRASRLLAVILPAAALWVTLHVASAAWRGGRLRHFLWPRPIRFLRQVLSPERWQSTRQALWQFVVSLRLVYYLWLGLRGFVGGVIWLAVPTTLLLAGLERPLVGALGGFLLGAAVLLLPLLQARMAATNQFSEMFAVRRAIGTYIRAPLASLVAIAATFVLAVPLYLMKIELIPREALWLPSLLFVLSIWPSRLLAGFAVARAGQSSRRWWRTTLSSVNLVVLLAPLALVYVVIVYFTQYLSWYGMWSLYEQHAFLVPVPFLGG
jgi:hypothetical protein